MTLNPTARRCREFLERCWRPFVNALIFTICRGPFVWILLFLVAVVPVTYFGFFSAVELESDLNKLFVPCDAPGTLERDRVRALFPESESDYVFGHESDVVASLRVIVTPKNSDTKVLAADFFEHLAAVDERVRRPRLRTVYVDKVGEVKANVSLAFEDLCLRDGRNECAGTAGPLFSLARHVENVEAGSVRLKWPLTDTGEETYALPQFFGGVVADDEDGVESVSAVLLTYPLRRSAWSDEWSLAVAEELPGEFSADVRVLAISSKAIELELGDNIATAAEWLFHTVCLVVFFAVAVTEDAQETALVLLGVAVTVACTLLAWGMLALSGAKFQVIKC